MSMQDIFDTLQSLMIVTIINFIVVTGATIGILYTIDKIKEKKEKDE